MHLFLASSALLSSRAPSPLPPPPSNHGSDNSIVADGALKKETRRKSGLHRFDKLRGNTPRQSGPHLLAREQAFETALSNRSIKTERRNKRIYRYVRFSVSVSRFIEAKNEALAENIILFLFLSLCVERVSSRNDNCSRPKRRKMVSLKKRRTKLG